MPNDRVEGRDAASSRRVPSHDGLESWLLRRKNMSMHKIPLTQTEEAGLRAHGLDIGTPSQLSDAFRQGIAWGEKAEREACAAVCEGHRLRTRGTMQAKAMTQWGADECARAIRERSNK